MKLNFKSIRWQSIVGHLMFFIVRAFVLSVIAYLTLNTIEIVTKFIISNFDNFWISCFRLAFYGYLLIRSFVGYFEIEKHIKESKSDYDLSIFKK
jgi:hypothetical protein